MIPRPFYRDAVSRALLRSPATALLGPRQCGKITLARQIGQEREGQCFDMESPVDRQGLQNPELALSSLSGLVIIDEITQFHLLLQTGQVPIAAGMQRLLLS